MTMKFEPEYSQDLQLQSKVNPSVVYLLMNKTKVAAVLYHQKVLADAAYQG